MQLPRKYNEKLQRVFPQLRVRWSFMNERWMIEEKVSFKRTVDPNRYPSKAFDSFIRFSQGYALRFELEPRELPSVDRLITGLRQGSAQRIMDELGVKNAAQWAALLDARDKAKRDAKWLKDKERGREYAGQFYDDLAWIEGRTISGSSRRNWHRSA